jgi:anti-sigma factor RsiW
MPSDGEPPEDDRHEYAMWDAAYVLGSLSYADRREFEAHVAGCLSCREAVAGLSGMPGLLSRLDRDEVAAMGERDDASGASSLRPEMLPLLLAKARWRRRRTHLMTWTAAAAAVLAVSVFVGVQGHSPASPPAPPQASAPSLPAPPQTSGSTLPMAQVGTTELASTFSLSSHRRGTYIDMKCVCLAPVYVHHDQLAMVVIGRDGRHTQLATWVAEPGHTATPAGSISTPVDQIASVQVVSADNGEVLLQRSL